MTNVTKIVIGIGVLSIIAGIYFAITGGEFQEYFFSIFIGITLIGTVYFNRKHSEKRD